MGIDNLKKKKKKKPNQLVSKRKDGKRPGYYGSDDYGSGEDGQGGSSSSSSDNGGGDDNNYMDYYVSPAPSPEPSYSVQDDLTDYATNVGSTASVGGGFDDDSDDIQDDLTDYATNVMKTADPEGGFEDDDDDGESLYVSPTQIIKEEEPYYGYTPGPNTVTADELSRFNRGIGDADELGSTFSRIQAVNPIENQGILSQIGSGLKTAAKFALPFVAAPIAGLVGGKTAFDAVNLGFRGKRAYDFAKKFGPTKDIATAFAKNFQSGTGNKPPAATGFDDNDSGSNNIIAKNVVASNIQKYSPEYINRAIDYRDKLQAGVESGAVLSKLGQQTLTGLNQLINQYQVKPETMIT